MAHKNQFLKIKKNILAKGSIRLQGLEKKDLKEKNVMDFLTVFFSKYNKEYNTIYTSSGSIQTGKDRRRTIDDVFLITYYYFPKVSLTKLYIKIVTLISEGKCVSSLCTVIHKRVYRLKTSYDKSNFFNGPLVDEYGIDFSMYQFQSTTFNKDGWGKEYTEEAIKIILL